METMKIYAFADEASADMDRQIAAMKRNHLQGLEIRNVDGTNISDISKEKAVEVHRKLQEAGLTVWSIGSPIGKISMEEEFGGHLEKFKHTLEIADILECKNIRLFSFFIPSGKDPGLYQEPVMERLKQMVEAARGSGIDLCHENEKDIYGDIAVRCLQIHKEIPELKGIFDPANFIQCGQDTLEAWRMLKPYIKYLHIKDALADGMVVPAGAGIGSVKEILQSFRAQGGTQVTVEPHLTIFEGLRELEGKNRQSRIEAFRYPDADTAFDTACEALKNLLRED
ncbi:MAG: sugar phosphate isomerase/epimerase [Lachnospiraceae bacterium]|nr:sugar phosphate isomerase/epimerase [Lachnospiraceae bacterium]